MKTLQRILCLSIFLVTLGIQAQSKNVNLEKSTIHWVGKKVMGQHEGTLDFKQGTLEFKNEKLVSGNLVVDMTTISSTDLEGEMKGMLDGHLKNDDFFGVDVHPTATLVLKKVKDNGKGKLAVTADMTIKGVTNEIKFDMTLANNTATAELKIDRTKYGIKYASKSFFDDLGDKVIDDIFELNVKLVF